MNMEQGCKMGTGINIKNVIKKLFEIQQRLKAPKDKYNSFGKYKYRSAESIIESVKPILKELNCVLVCESWTREAINHTRLAVSVSLIDIDSGEVFTTKSDVREDEQRAGMCASQNSGSSESFAKKYALGNLFAIDDSKDDDDDNLSPQNPKNRTQASEKGSTSASKDAEVQSPSPKAKAAKTEAKAKVSQKAAQAWNMFKRLESVKAMTDAARNTFWGSMLKKASGKVDARELSDGEWDKVIADIDIAAAV